MSESPAYSPRLRFDAELWRSFIDARSGVVRTASFAELTRAAMAVPDVLRADAEDDLRFAEALLVSASDSARALRLLDASIAFQREAGRTSRVAATLVERARLRRRTGNDAAATVDLETALSLTERQTEAVHDRDLRDSFFDTAAEACRQLVEVHADGGNPSAAFTAAERCRTRSLFNTTPPLALADLRRVLPQGTTLLQYTRLTNRLAIIAVTSSDVSMHVVAAPTLSYETLLAPVAATIRSGNSLVIVADEEIRTVSFPALRMKSGKYLIELHEIIMTPRASAWGRRPLVSQSAPRKALVLGDPAFELTDQHSLRRLPGAAREAQRVAALYIDSTLLLGEDATATRLTSFAQEADLIHIASHAFVNTRDARASALLLAGDGGNGIFTVADIAALRLTRSPLVVLAGCTTGNRVKGRGSVSSLAAAFLAAGAGGVIASLTDVDDEVTLYFSTALHTRLRSGMSPAAALRETQLEMLHSGNPRLHGPQTWGAFQLYGFE
jgi:CHAT domain-containing protein